MRLTDHVFPIGEFAERPKLLFAGGVVKPVPVIAAAEEKIAMRKHDQMIFIFAPAEVENEDIVSGQQEMFLPGAHVEDVQGVGCGPSRCEKIKPPAIGAELLAFKISELALGVAATALEQKPVIAVHIDAPQFVRPRFTAFVLPN